MNVKCVVCGDGEVGKTGMLITFTTGSFPTNYIPTVFDNYSHSMALGGKDLVLQLWDTAGQEDYKSLRTLSYPNTDIFIICFSVVSPVSFDNVKTEWWPELTHYAPGIPKILVGTKQDLRNNENIKSQLRAMQKKTVTKKDGERMARAIGAVSYHECSAYLDKEGLNKIFQEAVRIALQTPTKHKRECKIL